MDRHFLTLAIEAVMDGEPARPIEIAPGTYVRAEAVAQMLSPEALRRARAKIAEQRLLEAIEVAS